MPRSDNLSLDSIASVIHQLDDDEFSQTLADVAAGRLALRCGHACRIRLAWQQLSQKPWPLALATTCDTLRRLPAASGGQENYHHTLTVASLRLILQKMKDSNAATFAAFIAEHPELMTDFEAVISRYYSAETLARDSARTTFVSPDKRPLDG